MTVLRLLLLVSFFSVSPVVQAGFEEDLLSSVRGFLALNEGITGSFKQEKHLSFMRQPMVSTGRFEMQRAGGLRWQVLKPLTSLMVVQGGIVTLDGERFSDHGVGALLADIMLGVMTGDLRGMEENFRISGDISPDGWKLSLEPRAVPLDRILSHIELEGLRYLSRIQVVEKSGDRTDIFFSELSAFEAP